MPISFNEREKEILIDVLEAHLETLTDLLNDGDIEPKEEMNTVVAMIAKVREANDETK